MALLSFYWCGYQLVFDTLDIYVKASTDRKIEEGQYLPSQLTTIVVDLELPYTSNWQQFEKIEGEIWVDNVPHRFVERIYKDGKMIYHCLPDIDEMKLSDARSAVASISLDLESSNQGKSAKTPAVQLKKLVSECEEMNSHHTMFEDMAARPKQFIESLRPYSSYFLTIPTPPPDLN